MASAYSSNSKLHLTNAGLVRRPGQHSSSACHTPQAPYKMRAYSWHNPNLTCQCPHSKLWVDRRTKLHKTILGQAGANSRMASHTHLSSTKASQVVLQQNRGTLPEAYHTVLDNASSPNAQTWTADSSLETADRQAIKRAEQLRLDRHAASRDELPPPPVVITQLPSHLQLDVLNNALLLLDKPLDWEAEEVTRSLKWALGGVRIGYVGNLESGATGLMLLLFGKATWLSSLLQNQGSRYTGWLQLGVSTDTHDAAGQATEVTDDWQQVTDERLQAVAQQLVGRHVQVPPAFTAVKLRGKPIYELAKRRPQDELMPRPVTISSLKLERQEAGSPHIRLDVTFARTGYIRSLAHEIGQLLGCGAHLTSWRREAVGGFTVDNAWTLDVVLPVARKYTKIFKNRSNKTL